MSTRTDPPWPGPLPHTLLIAPGGKVVSRKNGPFDPLEVKRAIVTQLGRTYASKSPARNPPNQNSATT